MTFYLYAIAEAIERVDEVSGVTGEPLRILTLGGLDVVAAQVATPPSLSAQTLAAQDQVVRHLHAHAEALLPMRFGAAFASEAQMTRALELRAPALRDQLAVVRGKEQMTLRLLGAQGAHGAQGAAGATAVTAMTGVEYLRGRAAKGTPREIVPLLDAMESHVRARRVEPGRAPGLVATVYHLVDRGTSAEYAAALHAAARAMPELVIRASGPAPCYAFT